MESIDLPYTGEKRVAVVDSPDAAAGAKRVRVEEPNGAPMEVVVAPELPVPEVADLPPLKAHPYFRYTDYSLEKDPDSLQPPTPPGRVPNFPAKMHSILSRPELKDIISWLPHGRSWRIHKPREFEIKVIPTYFEHSKFSSFIRQANGWGFRRLTQGLDRNSYYHEQFLRYLPHLCKNMKRPGVAKKIPAEPDHEPDLAAISRQFPLPEQRADDSILLQCTVVGGPKARVPIYSGSLGASSSLRPMSLERSSISSSAVSSLLSTPVLAPSDQSSIAAFQQSLSSFETTLSQANYTSIAAAPMPSTSNAVAAIASSFQVPPSARAPVAPAPIQATAASPLAVAQSLTFGDPQFAAGFAAATLSHQQQFQSMMQSFVEATNALRQQQQGGGGGVTPAQGSPN